MLQKTICALCVVGVAIPQPAFAVNLYFMPGDAFFSASLSEESAAAIPRDGGKVLLHHHGMWEAMYFCGYAGFSKLEILDVPPDVAKSLNTLYRTLREEQYWKEETVVTRDGGEQERHETNPFLILVYDSSFDPEKHRFGLKYNEHWADPPAEALLEKRGSFAFHEEKYEKFIPGEEPLIRDWRDGPKVAPLPVALPAGVKWAMAGPGDHPPIVARFAQVRIFVTPLKSLDAIYKKKRDETFWEVTGNGYRRYTYSGPFGSNETELVTTDVPFDQPARLVPWNDGATDDEKDE